MNQIDYDSMTKAELREYFLRHREDKAALQAYMDRVNQQPLRYIGHPSDPGFEEKFEAAIRRQMEASQVAKQKGKADIPDE